MPLDPARQGARKRRALQKPTPRSRRLFHFGLLFVASVLVANALVGERGLVDSIAAGRRHAQLTREITGLRHENERLRHEAHRLRGRPRRDRGGRARRTWPYPTWRAPLALCPAVTRTTHRDPLELRGATVGTRPRLAVFVDRVGSRMLASRVVVDVAGWSSPVARWAHNPKVGGSNPPPATKLLQ